MSNGLVGYFFSSRTDLGDFMMYIFQSSFLQGNDLRQKQIGCFHNHVTFTFVHLENKKGFA